MSRVLVWRSDADGKLFEDKAKYVKHLRKLAGARLDDRRMARAAALKLEFVRNMGNTVSSREELLQFITDNWQWFFYNGLSRQYYRRKGKVIAEQLVAIKMRPFSYGFQSNSHSAPRGKSTNWCGRQTNEPNGYLGWHTRIEFVLKSKGQYGGFGSDYFADTGICTGTGGGGGGEENLIHYGYDVTLWADDFPAMHKSQLKSEMWEAMGGHELSYT